MIKPPHRFWGILSGKIPETGRLTAKSISEADGRVYCAVDPQERRHVLVGLNQGEEGFTDLQSRGIAVETRVLVLAEGAAREYIDILCRDAAGHPAFDLLAEEIARLLSDKNLSPAAATSRVLAKWRRFWGKAPVDILGREAQIGLFAELRFLSEWLIPRCGAEAAAMWRGPWGGRNDFESDSLCIEVKATMSARGRIYRVNNIDQLDSSAGGALLFFGMRLRKSGGGRENLTRAACAAREACGDNADALDRVENGLARVGYSDLHSDEYQNLRFEITEERLFAVRDNFPRLTADICAVPPGVERVEYDINLDAFDSLVVAKSPAEWIP